MELTVILSLKYVIFAYIGKVIVGACLLCVFWAISGIRTKRKCFRIPLVALMMALSIFIYVIDHRPQKTVQMKENVLYIRPK